MFDNPKTTALGIGAVFVAISSLLIGYGHGTLTPEMIGTTISALISGLGLLPAKDA